MEIEQSSRLYAWALRKANSQKAPLWIGVLFFLELILFIPLDAILLFFCLQNRNKTLLYVTIATIGSLMSGLVGYVFGHFLWDLIETYVVPNLISYALFHRLSDHFLRYEHWAVFLGALFPLPLKAVSLCAGIFHFGITPFAFYLFCGRFLRFSLIGGAMAIGGERMQQFVERHFHRIIMLLGAKIAMVFLFLWAFAH